MNDSNFNQGKLVDNTAIEKEFFDSVLSLQIALEQKYGRELAGSRFMTVKGRADADAQLRASIERDYEKGVERIRDFFARKNYLYGKLNDSHQMNIAGFAISLSPLSPPSPKGGEEKEMIEKPIS